MLSRKLLYVALAGAVLATASLAHTLPPLSGYRTREEAAAAAKLVASLSEQQRRSLFLSWKAQHGRQYLDDSAEARSRFSIWVANLEHMAAVNQQPGIASWIGMNAFSDLSADEVSSKFSAVEPSQLQKPRGAVAATAQAAMATSLQLPDQIDWRLSGKVSRVRDPDGCGSGWAKVAMSAIESRARIEGVDPDPNLSVQQMVDCVTEPDFYSQGCGGGFMEDALEFTSRKFAATESAYPYRGVTGACRNVTSLGAITLRPEPGFSYIGAESPEAVMEALMTAPLAVYWFFERSFFQYDGGVYNSSACEQANPQNNINGALVSSLGCQHKAALQCLDVNRVLLHTAAVARRLQSPTGLLGGPKWLG